MALKSFAVDESNELNSDASGSGSNVDSWALQSLDHEVVTSSGPEEQPLSLGAMLVLLPFDDAGLGWLLTCSYEVPGMGQD